MIPDKPNIIFILADQLKASSLPRYGEPNISTPHIDRLAAEGVTFDHAISSSPVCTPYRSMLLTGRHPQTTGHVINFLNTRHDEIGIGDVFSRNGYKTAWIGKWHLHRGSFPQWDGMDFVPEGRDRLGFDYWKGYNFHTDFYNGTINKGDWKFEKWEGYETEALSRYACEFMDTASSDPFCLFISPHQPHFSNHAYSEEGQAPRKYYDRLPKQLKLPANVPPSILDESLAMYRDYLAMTLAIDDMVGDIMEYVQRTGKDRDTLILFTSDHGTQAGAQGISPWEKKLPYEESIKVPLIMRWPGTLDGGVRRDPLIAPVDLFPTLCGLCELPIPRTVEGYNLASAIQGKGGWEQEAVLTMNFCGGYDHIEPGNEWRGVRTKTYSYARWLDGRKILYDIDKDPLQLHNLADHSPELVQEMDDLLNDLLNKRNDALVPSETYTSWFDHQRRVIRNTHGPLGDPEDLPDWSLLQG